MSLDISNHTNATIPDVDFVGIKKAVLGDTYSLSLNFIGPKKIQVLNSSYRKKDEVTDILSFPLANDAGEIFICPTETRRQSKNFGRDYKNFLAFLFIHGCVHLKGYDHGGTMEHIEAEIRRRFNI